jgi:glycosyltransferase involved in cell wall biosynthesis
MVKTYFIIPAWNEGPVIRQILNEVLQAYTEVVCVNDGSVDNTSTEIAKTRAILIEHSINLGQGRPCKLELNTHYRIRQQKFLLLMMQTASID